MDAYSHIDIVKKIAVQLDEVELQKRVRVIYACESGSRAWGFESIDSDFDVRFLYIHPVKWYLRINAGRDVIERPIDEQIDMSGWDLRKALQLLRKSNPPLLEWLRSPIVYRQVSPAISQINALVPEYYSPRACYYHYLHMAKGNNREYLQGQEVWVKKYFYVLRPVLACLWIEREYGVVPMEFSKLVERVVDNVNVLQAINDLVRRKRAGEELDRGPRIPAISNFLDKELAHLLSASQDLPSVPITVEPLDRVFRAIITSQNI
ncbi:hypothetical protein LCGC14_1792350 [marine sediment metagenome]|uniref:Nucleotidyltransferase n=1 Tax=marine sediment metagenome TaxID=412755 RepID=A0A0F9GS62_9ZZZZ|nr:nucleotidyltransferase domain-containing protein [Pricia sp.]